MAIEDLGVLRSIPELVLFEPCDEAELLSAMPQIIEHPGTVYLRLHRKELPAVHDEAYQCRLLQADPLSSGTDVTLLASGGVMVGYALQAAELLAVEDIAPAFQEALQSKVTTILEFVVDGTQLAPPFRRDAFQMPTRYLDKYAHLDYSRWMQD